MRLCRCRAYVKACLDSKGRGSNIPCIRQSLQRTLDSKKADEFILANLYGPHVTPFCSLRLRNIQPFRPHGYAKRIIFGHYEVSLRVINLARPVCHNRTFSSVRLNKFFPLYIVRKIVSKYINRYFNNIERRFQSSFLLFLINIR